MQVDATKYNYLASIAANLVTPSGWGQFSKNSNFHPTHLINVEKVQVIESDISVMIVLEIVTTGEDY